MQYMIKNLMRRKLVPALLSVALGIVIIIARSAAVDLLVKIVGGLVIACGIGFIGAYLTRQDPSKGDLKMVLVLAGIAVIVGLLLICYAHRIVSFFPTLMGIFLILNGLSHLAGAGADAENRMMVALIGAVSILFGILIVARPRFMVDAILVYVGAFFIVNGVMELFMVNRINGSLR